MNKITLRRIRVKEIVHGNFKHITKYEVQRVVGSVSPYVGEKISLDLVKDMCDQTGVWTVTFI